MAKGNVRIQDAAGASASVWTWQTEAGATDIKAGEPVKLKSAGSPYVIPLADAEPVIGTTTQVIGIAKSDSTHTATADGSIDVYIPRAGMVYATKAKTSTAFDTTSEVNALVGDRILFDLTSSAYTIDQSGTDVATSGCQIVGGNPNTQEVYFILRPAATEGPVA